MSNVKNIKGWVFGRLTVLAYHSTRIIIDKHGARKHTLRWLCLCSCDKEVVVDGRNLKSGNTKSCGCIVGENTKLWRGGKFYHIWKQFRQRCSNPKNHAYKDYGGRGIKVCDRWSSFHNFYEDMGRDYIEGLSIDRIDNNGDYCPENCKWVTRGDNSRKTRRIKLSLELANEIRSQDAPYEDLALKYKVSKVTISKVKRYEVWA